jgi:hypothetical protein
MRALIKRAMSTRTRGTTKYIGCSALELVNHLESTWQEGMSWGNYGAKGWQIDHIVPLCKFDLTKEGDKEKAFHFTNVRALWERENRTRRKALYDVGLGF